jgi:hypothetical protein
VAAAAAAVVVVVVVVVVRDTSQQTRCSLLAQVVGAELKTLYSETFQVIVSGVYPST